MEPQLVIATMHRLCLMTRDNPVLQWGVECKQLLAILTPPPVIVHTCTIIAYKNIFFQSNQFLPWTQYILCELVPINWIEWPINCIQDEHKVIRNRPNLIIRCKVLIHAVKYTVIADFPFKNFFSFVDNLSLENSGLNSLIKFIE